MSTFFKTEQSVLYVIKLFWRSASWKNHLYEDFYKRLGLHEYPFSTYTAENEEDKISEL